MSFFYSPVNLSASHWGKYKSCPVLPVLFWLYQDLQNQNFQDQNFQNQNFQNDPGKNFHSPAWSDLILPASLIKVKNYHLQSKLSEPIVSFIPCSIVSSICLGYSRHCSEQKIWIINCAQSAVQLKSCKYFCLIQRKCFIGDLF